MENKIEDVVCELLKNPGYKGEIRYRRGENEKKGESCVEVGSVELSFRSQTGWWDKVKTCLDFIEHLSPYIAAVLIAWIIGYYVEQCI